MTRRRLLAAGLGLIAVQVALRAFMLAAGYFRQDDFHYLIRAFESPFGWDYLMWPNAGHLLPGEFAISWVIAWTGGYDWTPAMAVTLVLLAGAGLALFRVLWTLFGPRPGILVPLALALFTPLTAPSVSWWAAAIALLPLQIAICMAVDAHVHYVRSGAVRHAILAAGWIIFGLLFFIKAAFIPVLLFLISAAYLGGWLRQWRAWVLYAVPVAAYAVLYLRQLSASSVAPAVPELADAVEFGRLQLAEAFLPAAFGGPWLWRPLGHDYATASAPQVAVWLCLAVAAVIIVWSVVRRRAWAAWFILLAYLICADVIPVLLGRLIPGGPALGLELRYVADAAPVLAICLGLAFLGTSSQTAPAGASEDAPALPSGGVPDPPSQPAPALPALRGLPVRVVAGVLGVAVLAGSAWSSYGFAARPMGTPGQNFMINAAKGLAALPYDATLIDRNMPGDMMNSAYLGEYARMSRALAPITPAEVRWERRPYGPTPRPMQLDDTGRLRTADIAGAASEPEEKCVSTPATFKLSSPMPPGRWTIKIAYFNKAAVRLAVRFGQGRATVPAGEYIGQTFTEVDGAGDTVEIGTDGRAACIVQVKAGLMAPR